MFSVREREMSTPSDPHALAQPLASIDDLADIDIETIARLAWWLRRLGRGYGPRGQRRFEYAAKIVLRHNEIMAEKRAMLPSRLGKRGLTQSSRITA